MNRDTGLLWANLKYFPYCKTGGEGYDLSEASDNVENYDYDGIMNFRIPSCYEFWDMISDKTFPFATGEDWCIKDEGCYWLVSYNDSIQHKNIHYFGPINQVSSGTGRLIPCSDYYIQNSDYKNNVSSDNPIYTEKERLRFTLDLFVQNELWPVFDDEEITQLYKKIYVEKPALLKQLQELQTQIEALQTLTLLSSEFDYTALLAKYDIQAIDSSIIKYYQAVRQWTDELMDMLDYYEKEKAGG